jgi:penicillin amidase
VLRDWFEVAIPTPGAYDTLNRGPSAIRDDTHPFEQRFGAGLRVITDLASPNDARMMTTPGQSGDPFSAHFADLLHRVPAVARRAQPFGFHPALVPQR